MNNIYQHRRHNKNLLMVHLIFAAKYRKALLFGTFRTDVKQYMFDACIEHHWYIRRMETDKDHIHILLQYNPMDSITGIVSVFKQYSTYQAWKNHGHMLKKTLLERKNVMVRWLFCCIDRTGISGNH